MRPVLFDIFGFPINSYGVSKALAALIAAYVLGREFRRVGWDPERAWNLVMATTVLGFAGGKLYYLAEHVGSLTPHDFGSSGFTWYGGLIAGVATVVVMTRGTGFLWGSSQASWLPRSPWLRQRTNRLLRVRGRHLRQAVGPSLGDGLPERDDADAGPRPPHRSV